jgi:pyrrolidone-carboxylate peptidase
LGLTKAELDDVKDMVSTSALSPNHKQLFKLLPAGNRKNDLNGTEYYEYALQIAGLDDSENYLEISTGISIYTLDHLFFTSKNFAEQYRIDISIAEQILNQFVTETFDANGNGSDFTKLEKTTSTEEKKQLGSKELWKTTNKRLFNLEPSFTQSFKNIITSLKTELDDVQEDRSSIESVIRQKGAELIINAKKLIREKDASGNLKSYANKDGMLYLSRLISQVIIKNHPKLLSKFPSYIQEFSDIFEKASRGLDKDAGSYPDFTKYYNDSFIVVNAPADARKILISGYDPFSSGIDWQGHLSNPSGNIALSLDGILIENGNQKAIIRSAIFPVRYREFNKGWIEDFITPFLDKVEMIITFSYGFNDEFIYSSISNFQLDRCASRKRNITKFDNNAQNNIESQYLLDLDQDEFLYEFIQNTLGKGNSYNDYSDWISNNNHFYLNQTYEGTIIGKNANNAGLPKKSISCSIVNDNTTNLVKFPDVKDLSFEPTYVNDRKITAIKGSGGDYLSNEIHYRVAYLRATYNKNNAASLRSGHIHVGFLKNDASNDRKKMLDILQTTLKEKILPTL